MFPPGGPEGFDMGQLMQQAQRMQEQLMSAQEDLDDHEVTGSAGGGLVRATMTGRGELTGLQIDPSVADPDDTETLSDLVVAAVRDAHAAVQKLATEQFGALGAGIEGLLGGSGGAGDALGAALPGGISESSDDTSSNTDESDTDESDETDTPPGRHA